MTSERQLAEFRGWALAVLDLLGAHPDRQVAFLQASKVDSDEILLQFDDLVHVAHARVRDGSLNHEDFRLIKAVDESVSAVSEGPELIWAVAALEEATEWRELRTAARMAKSSLERSWGQEYGDS
ncbi:hypothetical protein [Streptomyces cadmiisoli]|uniref:hypothetical protein n=1 Tax=Streptomyces cadmiisoli TaxID=2184053 RepID=UPI003D737591